MDIDLRAHVLNPSASWFRAATADRLELLEPGDAVTLAGPVRIRIGVHARNTTHTPAGTQATSATPLFDYTLRIPSGHTWAYALDQAANATSALGANSGVYVVIEPVRGVDEPRPAIGTSADVCCDAGVKARPDFGSFFPVGCETCTPQMQPTLPPVEAPLEIPVAPGGCVRPRYFDGMFLSREDLEAEQRYHLVKNRMQNRAAGAGVVWGLDVGLQGTSVCVRPGLAWDCCGHDLVVTAPYNVDTAALLRDPAAASVLAKTGAHRMHLLLEFVECPDDPRPVHGDPCSPDIASCEMARTRETVRLRLVPPRDLETTGPIDRFLDAVKDLPWDSAAPAPQPVAEVPFELDIANSISPPIKLVPSTTDTQTATRPDTPDRAWELAAVPTSGSAFTGDSVVIRKQAGLPDEVVATVGTDGALRWKASSTMFPNTVGELAYVIRWHAGALASETSLSLAFALQPSARIMTVTLQPTALTSVDGMCAFEDCSPEGERVKRFPADPPWLHPHPNRADRAADPVVLDLAWQYMSSYLYGTGPAPTEIDPRVQAALHDLCAAWCESLLYRGPRCAESPHGVVIGCALVDAGAIVSVDPWGGRRWSLQYGLLAHVAGQIGMLPPDLLLTKLAGLACCVGDLPRLGTGAVIGPNTHGLFPGLVSTDLSAHARVRSIAGNALAAAPPLLRSAAEDTAASIAEPVSLASLVDGSPIWLSRLAGAGVATIGSLLAASPEALHERVLHREHAAELNQLIVRAEETVTSIARSVGEALSASSRTITSRADIAGAARTALKEAIGKKLTEARIRIDDRVLERAVTNSTTRDRG